MQASTTYEISMEHAHMLSLQALKLKALQRFPQTLSQLLRPSPEHSKQLLRPRGIHNCNVGMFQQRVHAQHGIVPWLDFTLSLTVEGRCMIVC